MILRTRVHNSNGCLVSAKLGGPQKEAKRKEPKLIWTVCRSPRHVLESAMSARSVPIKLKDSFAYDDCINRGLKLPKVFHMFVCLK